jgi:hypothetical protein
MAGDCECVGPMGREQEEAEVLAHSLAGAVER